MYCYDDNDDNDDNDYGDDGDDDVVPSWSTRLLTIVLITLS